MENWATRILEIIDIKLSGVREKDLRFYRIDEFKRNIKRIDSYSDSCSFCQKQKIEILDVAEKIDEAVNVPGQNRRNFDRLIGRISKHMQKTHGFYPPYYFTYLFSFFGILVGLAAGFILIKLFSENELSMFSIGIIGLLPAYFWGSRRDKKIRTKKMLM